MPNILIIGPHPDDQELTMGGTIAKLAAQGHKVVMLDITDGEPTPRGNSATRKLEAAAALAALQPDPAAHPLAVPIIRESLGGAWGAGLPNRRVQHTLEARHQVAGVIRKHQAQILFVPYFEDAHPDHLAVTRIAVDARFDAKLTHCPMPGDDGQPPIYPKWLIYYYATHLRIVPQPGFIIDTTGFAAQKLASIACYKSQFADNTTNNSIPARIAAADTYFGSRIGTQSGEPFFTPEPLGLANINGLINN